MCVEDEVHVELRLLGTVTVDLDEISIGLNVHVLVRFDAF